MILPTSPSRKDRCHARSVCIAPLELCPAQVLHTTSPLRSSVTRATCVSQVPSHLRARDRAPLVTTVLLERVCDVRSECTAQGWQMRSPNRVSLVNTTLSTDSSLVRNVQKVQSVLGSRAKNQNRARPVSSVMKRVLLLQEHAVQLGTIVLRTQFHETLLRSSMSPPF